MEKPKLAIRSSEVLTPEDLIGAARTPGTKRKYSAMWEKFDGFCQENQCVSVPANEETVLGFLADLCNRGQGKAGKAMLTVIRERHLLEGKKDPTRTRKVMLATEGALRLSANDKVWPQEREPFGIEAIKHWVKTKPGSSNFVQARDAAIVALGFRAMLRPGELAKMKLADWKDLKEKVYLRIGRSKADQRAERKPIVLEVVNSDICPVKLTREYLVWRAIKGFAEKEQLFVSEKGGNMSTAGISSVVKKVAKAAGLEGKYSGHSLRIGGASASLEGGLSKDQIKAVGGWKSEAVDKYLRSFRAGDRVAHAMGF